MELLKRKRNRLYKFDYSTSNAYFITICTANRKCLFWENAESSVGCLQDVVLSKYGRLVENAVINIPTHYPAISVDHYVIMPNHLHLLLQINSDVDGRPMVAPTISTVVQQMKGIVSKQAGFSLWQKGFYDHIVRNDADYQGIWEYIERNPARWIEDRLYVKFNP